MSDPKVYQSHEILLEKTQLVDQVKSSIEQLNEEWEKLAESIDQLGFT